MKLIFCVLLLFVFHHDEIDADPNIDYKKPLELATVNNDSLPPPANQRPSDMEVAKYCPLQDVNYRLYQTKQRPSCVAKTAFTEKKKICTNEIKPKTVITDTPCGWGALTGPRYNFHYNVCKLGKQKGKDVVLDTVDSTIFEICYRLNTKQPLYTEHSIASNSYNPNNVLDPKKYMELFTQYIDVPGNLIQLRNIANAYQKILNEPISNSLDDPDYFIPQTLLPTTDFEPDYARGAHLTWAVVRPQYARLSGAWNSLNEIIWKKFHDPTLKAKIYAGTAQNLVVRGSARTIRVTNNNGTTSEITVPYIWWKAVKTNDAFFIVIFYNIPGKYDQRTITPLCPVEEKSSKTKQHCDYIRTNLKNRDGLKIECCSLTRSISEEINLNVPIPVY